MRNLYTTCGEASQCKSHFIAQPPFTLLTGASSRWETTNLMVAYSTPLELIEQLKVKIATYIDENSREWSAFALNIDKMEYQNAIHLIVAIERKYNAATPYC